MVKIFLISDFQLFLSGLAALLRARPDKYTVCGTAHCLESEIPPWGADAPDLVIIDLEMDIEGVLALLKAWKGRMSEKVLLIHRQGAPEHQEEILSSGAHGLIDRCCTESNFIKAVDRVVSGEMVRSCFDYQTMETIRRLKIKPGRNSGQANGSRKRDCFCCSK